MTRVLQKRWSELALLFILQMYQMFRILVHHPASGPFQGSATPHRTSLRPRRGPAVVARSIDSLLVSQSMGTLWSASASRSGVWIASAERAALWEGGPLSRVQRARKASGGAVEPAGHLTSRTAVQGPLSRLWARCEAKGRAWSHFVRVHALLRPQGPDQSVLRIRLGSSPWCGAGVVARTLTPRRRGCVRSVAAGSPGS